MRKITRICTLAMTALLFGTVGKAQTPSELLRFSQYDWSYGTARSAAMGGAFTSLGADLSSMMINPAGLGMYRRNEVGFTTSITSVNTKSRFSDRGFTTGVSNDRSRFAFNNVGAAFNVYNGSGTVTSISIGFTYNKLADFNTKYEVAGQSNTSMADYFAAGLNGLQLSTSQIDNIIRQNESYYMAFYPDMLAYQANAVYYDEEDEVYRPNMQEGAYNDFSQIVSTRGSIGQYDFSFGMNLSNQVYLGFGFGVQDIYYKETNSYYEKIRDNDNNTDPWALDDFEYYKRLKQTGTAWNFKIGAIIRPIEELRIGLAFHTPTYIDMDEDFDQIAYSRTGTVQDGYENESKWMYNYGPYNIKTPMRFLAGISYVFYNTAILSFDYERVWYDQMKIYEDDWDWENHDTTREVKSLYRPANNFRVGLETQLSPNWFGRLGFAYQQGMYKKRNMRSDMNMDSYNGEKTNYSAGFGYRTPQWGIDLAYIYMDTKNGADYLYNYDEGPNFNSKAYRTQRQRHNMTLTASWRF